MLESREKADEGFMLNMKLSGNVVPYVVSGPEFSLIRILVKSLKRNLRVHLRPRVSFDSIPGVWYNRC